MTSGFAVNVPAIREYATDLTSYREQAAKIKDMVGQADVGDRSWGVVGLFTKQGYTDTLHKLQELMDAVNQGLETVAGKMTDAADVYQGVEADHETMLNGLKVFLDGPAPGGKP
jgi:uncharacterized protein YukE